MSARTGRTGPPRAAARILGALHTDQGALTHLGDFAEAYAAIEAERGRRAADRWYWGQTVLAAPCLIANRAAWHWNLFRNYSVIFGRTVAKNLGYSAITLLGLAAGLACFLLVLAYVRFESSYDRFHAKADRIFRVLSAGGDGFLKSGEFDDYMSDRLSDLIRTDVPDVRRTCRTYTSPGSVDSVLTVPGRAFTARGLVADPEILDMFTFPLLRGDPARALSAPRTLVLTRSMALKLFGDRDPVGETLSCRQAFDRTDVTVSGVIADPPRNSSLAFDFLVSLATIESDSSNAYMFDHWNIRNFRLYVELDRRAAKRAVQERIAALVRAGDPGQKDTRWSLQPVTEIHLRSRIRAEDATNDRVRDLRLFMTIALLVLAIASFNFVNLVTARAATRAREIGVRKVTGADRAQLVRQFLGESVAVTMTAALLAFGAMKLVLPRFAAVSGVPLAWSDVASGPFLLLALGMALAVGLLSGTYPALVLSGFRPAQVLRERATTGRKGSALRKILVTAQFAASIALIACAVVVSAQLRFIRTQRLGFDRERIVVIPLSEPETRARAVAMKAEMGRLPAVQAVSQTSGLPTRIGQHWRLGDIPDGRGETRTADFYFDRVDEDFLKVFGIELASGRNFEAGEKDRVLVNESFMTAMAWPDLAGRGLPLSSAETPDAVVGVIRDFRFRDAHQKMAPLVLQAAPGGTHLAVRLGPGDPVRAVEALRDVFRRNTRTQPWDFRFLDDDFNALYKKEIRTGRIFGAFATLAVAIAALGLLGLAAFAVEKRRREIGIRKVMGASPARLTIGLSREFLALVLLGNVVAWPAAWYAMSRWLESFVDRVRLGPEPFVFAAAGAFACALLTVGVQAWRAASSAPAETLRYE